MPAEVTPKQVGFISRLVAKGLSAMTAAERVDVMKDAAAASGEALSKAGDLLRDGGETMTHVVEDQWDGPPDDHLQTHRTGGPDSAPQAGGSAMVGPAQSASGAGAERMIRTYSRLTPQAGVQAATERLGRSLEGMRTAMKAMLSAQNAQGLQIEALAASVPAPFDAAALAKAVLDEVAKLLPAEVAKALPAKPPAVKPVVKAKDEKEGEKGKEDEEEEEQDELEESGPGEKIEIVNELEDEAEGEGDDDEKSKAKAKSAAFWRLMAKNRLRLAKARLTKAAACDADGDARGARDHRKQMRHHFAKAQEHFEAAKGLGPDSLKLAPIAKSIMVFAKALPKPPAKNQDQWPKGEPTPSGTGSAVTKAELDAAIAKVSQAVEGTGMLAAKFSDVMNAISGMSRGDGVPPALKLALGSGDNAIAKSAAIDKLREQNMVTPDEADLAEDILTLQLPQVQRGNLDMRIVESRIERLPPSLRQIFVKDAA